MSFILPMLNAIVLFGSTFDLRKYEFTPFNIYNNSIIDQYAEVTNVSSFDAAFSLLESPVQLREFLGVDVATGLKAVVGDFPYQGRDNLNSELWYSHENSVKIGVKFILRTVNISVPYNTPTKEDWKSKGPSRVGSHYVKSIAYGADLFAVITITGRSEQHKNSIEKSISSTLGESGVFNSSFKEKFDAVLEEHQVSYSMSSFGSGSIEPRSIQDLEKLMNTFKDNVKENDGKGHKILFEMQSVSYVASEFPLVEINNEVTEKLEDVELKYDDITIAKEKFNSWASDSSVEFTNEQIAELEEFQTAIDKADSAMYSAIANMDITTTSGRADQFESAIKAYGDRNSTTRYTKWLNELKESIKTKNY